MVLTSINYFGSKQPIWLYLPSADEVKFGQLVKMRNYANVIFCLNNWQSFPKLPLLPDYIYIINAWLYCTFSSAVSWMYTILSRHTITISNVLMEMLLPIPKQCCLLMNQGHRDHAVSACWRRVPDWRQWVTIHFRPPAPTIQNNFPEDLRKCDELEDCKKGLKIHLFNLVYE